MSATTALSTACTFTCLQLISAPQSSHMRGMLFTHNFREQTCPYPYICPKDFENARVDGARLVDKIMESVGHLPFQNDLQLLVHVLVDQRLYLLLVLCFRPHSWLQGRCWTIVSKLCLLSGPSPQYTQSQGACSRITGALCGSSLWAGVMQALCLALLLMPMHRHLQALPAKRHSDVSACNLWN